MTTMDAIKNDNMRLSVIVKQTATDDKEKIELRELLEKYDTNNDGQFSTEEVCNILGDYLKTRKAKKNLRNYLFVAVLLIAILGVSNIGTAFVANNLTKELRVSTDGTMVSANDKDIRIKSMSTRASYGADENKGSRSMRRLLDDTGNSCFCVHGNHLEDIVNTVKDAEITLTFPYVNSDEVNVIVRGESTITKVVGTNDIESVLILGGEEFIRFVKTTNEAMCTTMLQPNTISQIGNGELYFAGGTFVPNAYRELYWDDPVFPADVKAAAVRLGHTRELWDGDYDVVTAYWDDLNATEKVDAGVLGYNKCTWDSYYYFS